MEFRLEILQETSFKQKMFFINYEKYVVLWFGKNFWSKNFLHLTHKIKSLKDKSVAKDFFFSKNN